MENLNNAPRSRADIGEIWLIITGLNPHGKAREQVVTLGKSEEEKRHRFGAIVRSDPDLMRLLVRLREIRLPEWRLVAGCLYQTVWNVLTALVAPAFRTTT
jgi:hypothetical protein